MIFIISVIQIYFFPNRKLCQYDAKMVFDSEKKICLEEKAAKNCFAHKTNFHNPWHTLCGFIYQLDTQSRPNINSLTRLTA